MFIFIITRVNEFRSSISYSVVVFLIFNMNYEKLFSPESDPFEEQDVQVYEWEWDSEFENPRLQLDEKKLQVKFHPGYSMGTAAVRGNKAMSKGRHHYWEVKMITAVYGTDVMVGVGTNKADLTSPVNCFCSLLGKDGESWGYSYKGFLQHKGQLKEYSACFTQGSVVGVHFDSWRGNLQFFLDRKPLGIAFTGLRGLELYPMVSSTAAKSLMRVTYSCSVPASLQMDCLSVLRPLHRAYLASVFPGLNYLSQSVFADILKKQHDDNQEDEEICDYQSDYVILDDYDFALIGCKRARKRLRRDSDSSDEMQYDRETLSNIKAVMLRTD